jgi:translation initiation factor 2 subunit 3
MQSYRNSIPSENEIVAIRIDKIHEYGVEVMLLEYNNKPGIIFNKDLSRKRFRSIKDIVRLGQETVACVTNIGTDTIDLSLRNCTAEENVECLNRYKQNKVIHGILSSVAYLHRRDNPNLVQELYETVVWPVIDREESVWDSFLALDFTGPYSEDFAKFVNQRMSVSEITLHRDIQIKTLNSLHAHELLTALVQSLSLQGCRVLIGAPPIYRIQVTGNKQEELEAKLNEIAEFAISELKRLESEYSIQTDDKILFTGNTSLDLTEISNNQATFNLGTLGNVSEGKSTFVRALSKTVTQRHKKEKTTNITINLGYAGFKIWYNNETGDLISTASSVREVAGHKLVGHYSFADCPGHEAYLATMLSGAAIMDAAVLMIASNSPTIPQIQTQEHLIAAELSGLSNIFVVQNKLDVVEPDQISDSYQKIVAFVKGTTAENQPIIPMSAQREWGIEHALHHIAYGIPDPVRKYEGPLRMQIVRSFDINRPSMCSSDSSIRGGIIGGTIQCGVLMPNDLLEIRPGLFIDGEAVPLFTRALTMNSDATPLSLAIAGGLIGVGTTLDPAMTSGNVLVGHVAGTPGTLPHITMKLKGVFKSFNRGGDCADANDSLTLNFKFKKHKEGDEIRFCVGSMTVRGKISRVGEKGSRTIKLDRPICAESEQICSILRSNGSRELLDGVFVVKKVYPYEKVRSPYELSESFLEIARTAVLSRTFSVIPGTKLDNATPLGTYERMLDSIETTLQTQKHGKVKLPLPVMQRMPKQTAWTNAEDVLKVLQENTPAHADQVNLVLQFQDYIKDELSTVLTVKSDGRYILKGRFTEATIRKILHKYMNLYHKCKQCGSCEVSLIKFDRALQIICGSCTSRTFVSH